MANCLKVEVHIAAVAIKFFSCMFVRSCSTRENTKAWVAMPSQNWLMLIYFAWEYRCGGSDKCEHKTCEIVLGGQWAILALSVFTVSLKLKIKS